MKDQELVVSLTGHPVSQYDMMKTDQQVHNIKLDNECKCPAMLSGFKNRFKYFACSLPLYGLKRVTSLAMSVCMSKSACSTSWMITIATAIFIAYDNAVLRQENAIIIQTQRNLKKCVRKIRNYQEKNETLICF